MNIHYSNPQFQNLPNELQNHICSFLPPHPNSKGFKDLQVQIIDDKYAQLFKLGSQITLMSSPHIIPITQNGIQSNKQELEESIIRMKTNVALREAFNNEPWKVSSVNPTMLKYFIIKGHHEITEYKQQKDMKLVALKKRYKELHIECDDLVNNYIKRFGDVI